MVRAVVSLIVAVILGIFGLPWCAWVLHHTWSEHILHARQPLPQDPLWVLCGALVGVALICWKRPNWFLHTIIHESCHALTCMALFVPVHSFRASRGQGGEVTHDRPDALRETLIAIAPYTAPLMLMPALLVVRLLDPGPWHGLASGVAAFAYVHHLQGLWHNVRLNFFGKDSDLVKVGRPLSLVLIAGILLLVTAWTIDLLW